MTSFALLCCCSAQNAASSGDGTALGREVGAVLGRDEGTALGDEVGAALGGDEGKAGGGELGPKLAVGPGDGTLLIEPLTRQTARGGAGS